MFTIAQHGDREERGAWPLFLSAEFPEYEEFWRWFIVELTGRIHDLNAISFLSKQELEAAGREEWHVEVAQLHYTILLHLVRVYDLRRKGVYDRDSFMEAIVRLDAATDTAFELLGHCLLDQGKSKSWDELAGKAVREKWDAREGKSFKLLHDYRNSLLHGRARTKHQALFATDQWQVIVPLYPRLDTMKDTLDWREADPADAAPASHIVDEAWTDVLAYLRKAWVERLIPWARTNFTEPDLPQLSPLRAHDFGGIQPAPAASADAPPATSTGGSITSTYTRPPDDQSD